MRYTPTEQRLLSEMERLPVVDAHNHLPSEEVRLREHFDALTFYRQYTRLPMFAAGLSEADFLRMHDPAESLDVRFEIFERWKPAFRFSSAGRAASIALQHYYGETQVTRDNFDAVTDGMRRIYRPNVLYQKCLVEACGIRYALQNSPPEEAAERDPLLRLVPMIGIGDEWNEYNDLAQALMKGEPPADSLDDYLDNRRERLRTLKRAGAVAFKHFAHPSCPSDAAVARTVWHQLQAGDATCARSEAPNPLLSYLTDELLAEVSRLGAPVAFHTGVWGDFREYDPQHLIPYFQRHPDLRFDLFHMGIPYARAMGRIGANFRNVWLNMCWAPTISTTTAANALDEWLDMVPPSKIIAFGSDVRWPIEKVFGHLSLAREVVAMVLARRIDRQLLNHDDAIELSRMWLFDNPIELYRLKPAAMESPGESAGPRCNVIRRPTNASVSVTRIEWPIL
jgi:hypothetical protein